MQTKNMLDSAHSFRFHLGLREFSHHESDFKKKV
jgi:hypothetical protein